MQEGRRRFTAPLVAVETRLTRETLDQLKQLAAANERSVAAELRVAVQRHLAEAA